MEDVTRITEQNLLEAQKLNSKRLRKLRMRKLRTRCRVQSKVWLKVEITKIGKSNSQKSFQKKWFDKYSYFYCVEKGHIRRDFPKLVQLGGSGGGQGNVKYSKAIKKILEIAKD